jgi:glycerophosphoryl diester phosphodiesterase
MITPPGARRGDVGGRRGQRRGRGRRIGRALVTLALLLVTAYALAWRLSEPRPQHPYYTEFLGAGPHVMAHQGGDHVWPGNTMVAFEGAHALGVDALELDVHLSADGEVVVIHDATVDRTSDGRGAVAELTLAELRALDFGFRWRPAGGAPTEFPYRGQGLTIPTLQEVLEAFPETAVNIELKPEDTRLVAITCDLIRKLGRERTVLVASFSDRNLRDFRSRCPEVATSAATREAATFAILDLFRLGHLYTPSAEALQVPVRQAGIEIVTERSLRTARDRRMRVEVWTINDEAEMRRLFELGVDGVITDRPDLALRALGR